MSQLPAPAHPSRHGPHAGRRLFGLLGLAALACAGVLLATRSAPSEAADDARVDIVYVSVTNEGATAKAWYDGAPSPGVPVQDALTRFAREGYRVQAVTHDLRSAVSDTSFVVLLQRVR